MILWGREAIEMALAPPAGYGTTLLVVTWVQASIASVLLLARVYTTWRITRHIRSDLFLALLTYVRSISPSKSIETNGYLNYRPSPSQAWYFSRSALTTDSACMLVSSCPNK